jgi:hypothetical protein
MENVALYFFFGGADDIHRVVFRKVIEFMRHLVGWSEWIDKVMM